MAGENQRDTTCMSMLTQAILHMLLKNVIVCAIIRVLIGKRSNRFERYQFDDQQINEPLHVISNNVAF